MTDSASSDTYRAGQSAGCYDRLQEWARGRGLLAEKDLAARVRLSIPGSPRSTLIERRGASYDESAWYLINALRWLGVEVP